MIDIDGILMIPFIHGKTTFAVQIRKICLNRQFDCIACDIPEPFEQQLLSAVRYLPYITAVVADSLGDPLYYIPTDPCDATIEAIRQAQQNRIAFKCTASSRIKPPAPLIGLPDEHAIDRLGYERYTALCLYAVGNPEAGTLVDLEAQYIAYRLRQLQCSYNKILAPVHLRHFSRIVFHLGREKTHNLRFPPPTSYRLSTHYINPDHLYFCLGELPFITAKVEKERYDPFARPVNMPDVLKDLFRETRDHYYTDKQEIVSLSPVRIQAGLTFLRNLTLMEGRLMPSLVDIVAAAKAIGGNGFALRILKSAKYYPYLPLESSESFMSAGIDKVLFSNESVSRQAVNLFRDTALVWRSLELKPEPGEFKKKKYRYAWNPFGMCSHIPEDNRIESFNAHVRKKAQRIMAEDFVKTERFSTSVKDGVDIRETLRNWYTGDIYVKEIPPSRGPVDTVIIIFDDEHDERYSHCTTWYAEHDGESTLTYYATNPFDDMIGPGIARSFYGGLSLLFPPRPIPNIFAAGEKLGMKKLSHCLVTGALAFSNERNIAYIAKKKPDIAMRMLQKRYKKHLVWVPLANFSTETIRGLRRFHVLNGKKVRSWASRFIG